MVYIFVFRAVLKTGWFKAKLTDICDRQTWIDGCRYRYICICDCYILTNEP